MPLENDKETHMTHCNMGDYEGSCKYGEADCPAIDEIDEIIENAVGELYRGFYRLRQSGQYQREYDEMGILLSMLMSDRQHLREEYKVDL